MNFSVRKREPGINPGGYGGWMTKPWKELEKKSEPPKEDWEDYIREKHGSGEFWVCGNRGGIGHGFYTVFKGEIRR